MIKHIGKQKKCILILLAGLWLIYLFVNRNVFQATENLESIVKLQVTEQAQEGYTESAKTFRSKQNYISGLEVRINKMTAPEKLIVSIATEKGKILNQYLVEPKEETRNFKIDIADELYVGKNRNIQITVRVYAEEGVKSGRCTVYYYPFLKLECLAALLCEAVIVVLLLWDILRRNSYLCKPDKKVSVWILLFLILQSGISFCLMEYTFENPVVGKIEGNLIVFNWACIFSVYVILMFLFNSVKVAVLIAGIFFQIWGMANRYVYMFKGQAVQPIDLKSLGTAMTVASEYDYTLTWEMRLAISVLLLSFILWLRIGDRKIVCRDSFVMRVSGRIPGIVLAGIVGYVLFGSSIIPDMKLTTNMWTTRNCFHKQGTVVAFCNYWHNMQIDKPKGYSAESVSALEEEYVYAVAEQNGVASDISDSDAVKPNIIVVMNEAFSDLSYYGEFETDVPYMENYNAISENAIKGYALANIFGAGTANSEYEVLTGHTLTFMPNSIPYAAHIQEKHYSIATTLAAQGYETTAIHPMRARNWRRNVVYPYLGFESFLSTDNMDFTDVDYERNYISDAHTYKMVMETLEEENGKPDLILDITVQNHGGYKYVNEDFKNDVHFLGFDSYVVDQYLSLIRRSDAALGEFIQKLEEFEEPTILVFFGDHYPKLPDEFYKWINPEHEDPSIETLQKLYSVPFFIWANYDIEEEEDVITSLNYLGAKTLKVAGVEMTPYDTFRLSLAQEIPAINQFGYVDTNGNYHTIEEASEHEEKLLQYWTMQYNEMFDQKGKVEKFFTVQE